MINNIRYACAAVFLMLTLLAPAQQVAGGTIVQSNYDATRTIQTEQLQSDARLLKIALEKCHPGLYWHQTPQEFEEEYSRLMKAASRPMTDLEFYTILTPFIGSIRCDHTNMDMPASFYDVNRNKQLVFPFILKVIGSRVYILHNFSNDSTILPGSEVLSINGISADSILRFVTPLCWADGYVESYAYLNIESIFTPLFLNFFHQAKSYSLNLKMPSGEIKKFSTDAVIYKQFRQRYEQQQNKWLSSEYQHFSFTVIDSLSTGIIKINAFEGDGYYKFLNSAFDELKRKGLKNLIIDLRGNGGGEGEYSGPLYRRISLQEYKELYEVETKLWDQNDTILRYGTLPDNKKEFDKFYKRYVFKATDGRYMLKYGAVDDFQEKPFTPRKDAYRGNVYFLTDVQSSSGSSAISSLAHYNKRATFVGRETGGGYVGNCSGWMFAMILPNSRITVYVPLFRFTIVPTAPPHRGIPPDYPLKEEINDVILHRDSDLLFTLDLIRKARGGE